MKALFWEPPWCGSFPSRATSCSAWPAPGFRGLRMSTQIDGGPRQKTLFVPMLQEGVTIDLLAGSGQPAGPQPKLVTEAAEEPAQGGRALLANGSASAAAAGTGGRALLANGSASAAAA